MWLAVAFLFVVCAVAAGVVVQRARATKPKPRPVMLTRADQGRKILFEDIQPVKLSNCQLERFGEQHDGGYLLCGNLLGGVKAAYSYGISGYDQWGCDVSTRLGVPAHQYDCFNLTRPTCSTGKTVFHPECIGDSSRVEDGRPFDTLENQVRKNRDAGKHLVVKMDVEGSEWESFLGASDEILQRVDQLVVEFHGFDEDRYILAIAKLKGLFHIANLHWNNFACNGGTPPFPSWAYEILFVNKRLGVVAPGQRPLLPHPLDRPNTLTWTDCQVPTVNSER